MLGAIVGDIVGSIYEFDNHKSKDFPLFKNACFLTDDTVLGGMFRQWLGDPSLGPYDSFGDGSAMRVSPIARL